MEEDFPRGGASVLTPLEVRQIRNEAERDVLFEVINKFIIFKLAVTACQRIQSTLGCCSVGCSLSILEMKYILRKS